MWVGGRQWDISRTTCPATSDAKIIFAELQGQGANYMRNATAHRKSQFLWQKKKWSSSPRIKFHVPSSYKEWNFSPYNSNDKAVQVFTCRRHSEPGPNLQSRGEALRYSRPWHQVGASCSGQALPQESGRVPTGGRGAPKPVTSLAELPQLSRLMQTSEAAYIRNTKMVSLPYSGVRRHRSFPSRSCGPWRRRLRILHCRHLSDWVRHRH